MSNNDETIKRIRAQVEILYERIAEQASIIHNYQHTIEAEIRVQERLRHDVRDVSGQRDAAFKTIKERDATIEKLHDRMAIVQESFYEVHRELEATGYGCNHFLHRDAALRGLELAKQRLKGTIHELENEKTRLRSLCSSPPPSSKTESS